MKLEKIVISGNLQGNIWMPNEEAEKFVSVTFTPHDKPFTQKWDGLRSAIASIERDGDFRSCILRNAMIESYFTQGNERKVIFHQFR